MQCFAVKSLVHKVLGGGGVYAYIRYQNMHCVAGFFKKKISSCSTREQVPEPIRQADLRSREAIRQLTAGHKINGLPKVFGS
jgi:hypothetical protein